MQVESSVAMKKQVEDMGVVFEKMGRSPMVGRVYAYLMLAEPPYKSFDEIREFLLASKSAISNALNALMKEGAVDYMTFSGDRKRYFKLNLNQIFERTNAALNNFDTMNQLLEQALEARKNSKHLDFNEGLQREYDFNKFIYDEVRKAVATWREENL